MIPAEGGRPPSARNWRRPDAARRSRRAASPAEGDDPHGPRVTPLVVDDLPVDLLRGQEPLLWGIALASGSDLQRGMSLEVAVPVGPLAPPRSHDRLP